MKYFNLLLLLLLFSKGFAQDTQVLYLSGTGADKTVNWEFFCSSGMNSGKWTTIAVPSCWELQGFGSYNFGRSKMEDRIHETGMYRYRFIVPSSWKNKEIKIVFDGVMTDAAVKINGKSAGPVHQGAFYQFKYDITKLIRTGKENELEVLVKEQSDNITVSRAERESDYWVFGGIYRPVYLEAKPMENIQRVAVDASANGDFQADIFLSGLKNTSKLLVEIQTLDGRIIKTFQTTEIKPVTHISGKVLNPETWTPEFPNLYNCVFKIEDKNARVIHQMNKRIGFRTVEVRESDGIYVNGVRIKMKGVCRHTFHPKYGRTSFKNLSVVVVNLIKDMNMNAVRMSHYPPDEHFLDVCDSLGLFVLDELAGWQKPSYDDIVGRKLLEEMIARDVNHPSIILWDNGNEGGDNPILDNVFAELDIQERKVLHPWQDYDLVNTLHYIDYNYLSLDGFNKRKIFLTTEFLHGLYDGGLGAGLEDYWQKMRNDPLCAGGFFWVFADESVERTDLNRELDSDGNHAPDGILGPYHEKEGSFYTIREIWSPVYFEKRYITPEFNGIFHIENRYIYTDLDKCSMKAEWVKFPGPDETSAEIVVKTEDLKVKLEPGQKGILRVTLPAGWNELDVLRINLVDWYGRELNTWTWPLQYPEKKASELLKETLLEKPVISENDQLFIVNTGNLVFSFSRINGTIQKIEKEGQLIPLSNGPVFVSREKNISQVTQRSEGNNVVIETIYENGDWTKWTVKSNGLLDLETSYEPLNNCLFAGISFNYPEKNIAGMKWLGNGPYRVYKNRMKGVEFAVWEKAYNNTVTGESGFIYPEFKGYHSEIYWVKVLGEDAPDFTVFVHNKDIFFRMLTPQEPKYPLKTGIEYPTGDISFLHGINAIGTKFSEPPASGPQSHPYQFNPVKIHEGKLYMKLTFKF